MKTNFLFIYVVLLITCVLIPFATFAQSGPLNIIGAWKNTMGDNERTMICSEKYYAIAIYNIKDKRFVGTYGGSYRLENGGYAVTMEFHSLNPETIGNEYSGSLTFKDGMLSISEDGGLSEWKKVDDGKPGKLAGAWVITGHMRDGKIEKRTPGARRTMKILSGTRFQWIAYNVDTHEFSGTGGGTYTTRNGKYVENLEFFSRDNSRVGASLTFDYSIEDGSWRHKGSSSKGEPIDEVWTRREKIGL
jgi:hypothetical protein